MPFCLLAFLDGFGGSEMLLILAIVLILFGGEKMPELARGLGKSIREFKKAAGEVEKEFKHAMENGTDEVAAAKALLPKPPLAPTVPATPVAPVAEIPPPAPDKDAGSGV